MMPRNRQMMPRTQTDDAKEQTDDAEDADDDTDVAVIATILDRESQQPAVCAVCRRNVARRLHFRFPRDLCMR